ncbi:MAG: 6-hydroxymethylpterin diphosphokinase MptE-like protein, partial [Pseudomonadota bacterium]
MIAVYEPEPKLSEASGPNSDYVFLKENHLFVTADSGSFNELVTQETVHGDNPDPEVHVCPGYETIYPDHFRTFNQIIMGARLRRAVMDKTLLEKGRSFLSNLTVNFKRVLERPDLTGLKGRLCGCPGFIVGSGPGLEKNLHLLKNNPGRGLIIAAASALKPLREGGIEPDMVVVIEAEDTSSYLDLNGTPLNMLLALASA